MTKILMVCLGNICRSPLAHGILESLLPENMFYVDSAGTSAYHIGEAPDPRSIKIAMENGIDISYQSARQFTKADFDHFDYIYAMDTSNLNNILRLAKTHDDRVKVKLILDENPNLNIQNVPDPYYGGERGFKEVFTMLNQSCQFISNKLLESED